ncbi:MAG: hypothetical protein H6822_20500 [Planctomycetaceae bacterium]|nr:hypothetical protein [Planctomycetales bacterium]MCB9924571.1 hypothetical protein [Planctomycetaceae bacterium]
MNTVSDRNFGLLIAYLVPGFTALLGVSYFSPTVASWLHGANADGPTIGGFLYVTIASVAAGMICSAVRFHVIDRIHHVTGIRHPSWDFTKLGERIAAYDRLIEIHYSYYKFHSNGLVALLFFYMARQIAVRHGAMGLEDIGTVFLGVLLFVTSRDNLAKYFSRVAKLLGTDDDAAATTDEASQQLATE